MTDKELERKIKAELDGIHAPEGLRAGLRLPDSAEREDTMNNNAENKTIQETARITHSGRAVAAAAAAALVIGGGAFALHGAFAPVDTAGPSSSLVQLEGAEGGTGAAASAGTQGYLFEKFNEAGAFNSNLFQIDRDRILVQQWFYDDPESYVYTVYSISQDKSSAAAISTDYMVEELTDQGFWLSGSGDGDTIEYTFYSFDMEQKGTYQSSTKYLDVKAPDGSEVYELREGDGVYRLSDGSQVEGVEVPVAEYTSGEAVLPQSNVTKVALDTEDSCFYTYSCGEESMTITRNDIQTGEVKTVSIDVTASDVRDTRFLKSAEGKLWLTSTYGDDYIYESPTDFYVIDFTGDEPSYTVDNLMENTEAESAALSWDGKYLYTTVALNIDEYDIDTYDSMTDPHAFAVYGIEEQDYPDFAVTDSGETILSTAENILYDDVTGDVLRRVSVLAEGTSDEWVDAYLAFNLHGGEYTGAFGMPADEVPQDETQTQTEDPDAYENAGEDIDPDIEPDMTTAAEEEPQDLSFFTNINADYVTCQGYGLSNGGYVSIEKLYGGDYPYRCRVYDTDGTTILNEWETELPCVDVLEKGFALTTVKNGKSLTPEVLTAEVYDDQGQHLREISFPWDPDKTWNSDKSGRRLIGAKLTPDGNKLVAVVQDGDGADAEFSTMAATATARTDMVINTKGFVTDFWPDNDGVYLMLTFDADVPHELGYVPMNTHEVKDIGDIPDTGSVYGFIRNGAFYGLTPDEDGALGIMEVKNGETSYTGVRFEDTVHVKGGAQEIFMSLDGNYFLAGRGEKGWTHIACYNTETRETVYDYETEDVLPIYADGMNVIINENGSCDLVSAGEYVPETEGLAVTTTTTW